MTLDADIVLRLQCSVFVDAQSLRDDGEFLPSLQADTAAAGMEAIPTGVQGPEELVGAFLSVDGKRQMLIQTERFDYNLQGPVPAQECPEWESFASDAAKLLGVALKRSHRSGRRLAFNSTELASNRIARATTPSALGHRFLHAPPHLGDKELEAWEWRWPYRDNVSGEECNLISRVRRIRGLLQGEPYDGIELNLDVNTLAERARLRFDAEDLSPLFHELVLSARVLRKNIEEVAGAF